MLTPQQVTNLYLYGQLTKPLDLVNEALIRPEGDGPSTTVPVSWYMDSGPGRFANPVLFDVVNLFFTSPNTIASGTYTEAQIRQLLGTNQAYITQQQWAYSDTIDDFAERTYIWNTVGFEIDDQAQFIVAADGTRSIQNFAIIPYSNSGNENFDFESSDYVAIYGGGYEALSANIDPSGIGRVVDIGFTGSVQTVTYGLTQFQQDASSVVLPNPLLLLTLLSETNSLVDELWNSSTIQFLSDEDKPVGYGTVGGDFLDVDKVDNSYLSDYIENGVILIGGGGNDTIVGGDTEDILYGGDDNDYVTGGGEYDVLYDGDGQDILEGGDDDDYILSNDGDADIIIVGGDYSYIEGGDANDRIVIRTDMLGLNPDPDLQTWSNPATGLTSGTTAIPLLGGFYTDIPGQATYEFVAQHVVTIQPDPPEDPDDPDPAPWYELQYLGSPRWSAFVNVDHDVYPVYNVHMEGSFEITYSLHAQPTGVDILAIDIDRWVNGTLETTSISIYDFEEGDFGIEFEDRDTFVIPPESGEGWYTYAGNNAHVSYINNGNSYFTVPSRISEESEQNRFSASNEVNLVEDGGLITFSTSQDASPNYENRAIPVAFEGQSVMNQTQRFAFHDSAMDQSDPSNYVSFEGATDISLADIATDYNPGDYWFEPEPIGGLV